MRNTHKYNSHKKKVTDLKRNSEIIRIPIFENVAIALKVDLKKKKEIFMIDELKKLKTSLYYKDTDKIFLKYERPIGSFLFDIQPMAIKFADIKIALSDTSKQNRQRNISLIEDLYNNNDNPLLKYLALKLWQEHNALIKQKDYPIIDRIEDLTLPYRINFTADIIKWQRKNPYNPLIDMPYDFFKYPTQYLCVPEANQNVEYIISDFDLMSVIVYYLKTIYEKNKYFCKCKVCGKWFLSPDVVKTTMCSAKCKKKQQKINKRKYDDATRDVDYERTYRNEKMYWYNRLQKAKNHNIEETALNRITKAYDEFKRVANIKKKQVKEGLLSFTAFDGWYLDKRCEIDELMESFGLGKYK
jgi:hypothetical protein